jgi:hypothetical protein
VVGQATGSVKSEEWRVKRQRAAANEGRARGVDHQFDVIGGSSYRCCAWGKSGEEEEAWAARREGSVEARR